MRSLLVALLLLAAPAASAETVIRMATLAPEGSSWMKLFHAWQKNIETRTAGRVKVRIYGGGVQGDERDVLRKINLGQLSGGAVTGVGLSAIDLEVRTIDAARSYAELDKIRERIGGILRKRFEDRGYILLGWGDVGPVHLFANKEVKTLADLQSLRLWLWSDDPVSKQLFKALEVRGVPMGVPDVLPALSTGTIDAFFASPLSAIALQWQNHAKYISSMVMTQATGATVLSKKAYESLSPEDQKILMDESRAMEAQVLKMVREDNARALVAMKTKFNLQTMQIPPELEAEMRRRGEAVAVEIGKSFSPETRAQIEQMLDEFQTNSKRNNK